MLEVKAKTALRYIDQKRDEIIGLSDRIWELAELALHEDRSAELLTAALRQEGFSVETGQGGMPTAFVATWGSGRPVIGFLGEYDALAGISQKAVTHREPLDPGAGGHGCGHNLLGAGVYGAVVGLKREMEARGLAGTIKYYGCPAEENLSGKAFMAREGVFDCCDACLTWHPTDLNRVWSFSFLANNAANFTFYGRSAHAAGDPHNGRSALDAVQLMNLGVEFLREHMPTRARVHYVITNGGGQPNVVPPEAKVWYLVRSPRREEVDDLWARVVKCANGAAEMTETRYEIEMIKAIWNVLSNSTLEDVLEESLKRVGPPVFGPAEQAFAAEIGKTIPQAQKQAYMRMSGAPEDMWGKNLNDTVLLRTRLSEEMSGSTDVGDVSWCCPTAQFGTACAAMATPGHSWQLTAQSGMGIGHGGMITAAKVLAEAGLVLLTEPDTLQKVKSEFAKQTGGRAYKCAMPPDHKPAFHQFGTKT
jgi:aminobenzoyl-glutamate utilization protein B